MKLAVFSESPADDAAIRILANAVLKQPAEPTSLPALRTRGWTQMANDLPRIIKSMHYGMADALIIVADGNGSPIHTPQHDVTQDQGCRLCRLCAISDHERKHLRARSSPPLRIALGLAVPAIEAWLLTGTQPGITEQSWITARNENRPHFSRGELKIKLYGTKTPSLQKETTVMCARMKELVSDLEPLKRAFPNGFLPLYTELASWR